MPIDEVIPVFTNTALFYGTTGSIMHVAVGCFLLSLDSAASILMFYFILVQETDQGTASF